ncbi:MAG: type II toxin-antitoxin system HigB family toxin [Spirochaetia bacterium]|nr:type II toxin-antitoxin system HigB family toxin [Spirochaetia bacterium]
MRIIAKRTITAFYEKTPFRDSKSALEAWYDDTRKSDWKNPSDIKEKYRNASILQKNRVIFNIHGNKYRLVVKLNYDAQIVYIRFIGAHAQYDKIDSENI